MTTSIKLAVVALALIPVAGCAASAMERGTDLTAEPRAGVRLGLIATESATEPSFPARLTAPTTPMAADRLAHRVRAELGGHARADLQLCVGGDGAVTTAEVVRGSGITALDAAFLADARTWRYQPLAAPSATACQKVEIAYTLR